MNNKKRKDCQIRDDFKTLPSIGIFTNPKKWKMQKAVRDNQLSKENNLDCWIFEGKLYNFQKFLNIHPGGKSWLKNTQGHDITQLFITHHLNQQKARNILEKYFVKNCNRKINRFTFQKHNLYRTVKQRLLQKYDKHQIQNEQSSKIRAFLILFLFIACITLCSLFSSYLFSILSGIMLIGVFGIMHNFIHHKQNYYAKLVGFVGYSFDDFQILHCISHHVYPNTQLDFQITGLQPLAFWLKSKARNKFYTQILLQPILMCASILNILFNLIIFPLQKLEKPDWDYFIPVLVLFYMYFLNGNILVALKLWTLIYCSYSFVFFKVLLCQHRMPQLWTAGQAQVQDFGQQTVNSTSDVNPTITGLFSLIFLAGFNLHAIHHFFPTADHSILPKINKILIQVLQQKKIKYHSMGRIECAIKYTEATTLKREYQKNQ